MTARPEMYRFHNGEKAPLQFAVAEYEARIAHLRSIMSELGVEAAVFTSMHNISYYSGFTYCSFGRPYGLVVTADQAVTISAGIDAGQPWRRSFCDNITYTDWQRDNFWRAILSVTGAGDTLMAALVNATLAGVPLPDGLARAQAAASLSLQSARAIHPGLCQAAVQSELERKP